MTVTRLGAFADVAPDATPARVSVSVEQFALLDDGRRFVLDEGRGFCAAVFGSGGAPDPVDPWSYETRAGIEDDVRNTVLPDDDDGEQHPWEWLVARLGELGVEATVEQLRRVPYDVVLGERLLARLGG